MLIRPTSVLMLAMAFTACGGYNSRLRHLRPDRHPHRPAARSVNIAGGASALTHDGVRSEPADDRCWDDNQLAQRRRHRPHVQRRLKPVVVGQHPAGRPVQLHVPIGGTIDVPLPDSPEYGRHDRRAVMLVAHCDLVEAWPTRRPNLLVGRRQGSSTYRPRVSPAADRSR